MGGLPPRAAPLVLVERAAGAAPRAVWALLEPPCSAPLERPPEAGASALPRGPNPPPVLPPEPRGPTPPPAPPAPPPAAPRGPNPPTAPGAAEWLPPGLLVWLPVLPVGMAGWPVPIPVLVLPGVV